MATCPESLKQHLIIHGIDTTIDQMLVFSAYLLTASAKAAMSYEADEYDHHRWAQCQRNHEALLAAKALCE
jgi:hypothetical protein